MENKSHALMAGLFTLALLVAGILMAMWFNRDRVARVPYEMATKLSVPGLNPQADVRYRGLDVGKVDEIIFDPKEPGQILIHISVKPDTPMTHSTYGVLGYQGVTGIAYVQLDDDGSKPVKLTSSKEQLARIEMRPGLFENLQTRGLAILKQTEELTLRLNNLMTPANQAVMLGAFSDISKAAIALEAIPAQLAPTLSRLPELTTQASQTLASINTLAVNTDKLADNLVGMSTRLQAPNGTLDRLTLAADQLGSAASRIEREIAPLGGEARSTLRAVNRTLDTFNSRPQSILFGAAPDVPGPGEAGFVVPAH
ncbi:MAG: phospholipid/cholesterol/gamma-HCH transport system substrate-binding protein [Candidatus Paceibacteria bacterium]|jgi:phospholipid/cholesterol/gamma-HCH transport system substrate-binding protein